MLSELEYGGFVDLVYEAAVEPQLWVRVLERFADLAGGAKAWMPTLSLSDGGGDGLLARIEPERQTSYFEYYAQVNPFFIEDQVGPNANWPLRVVTDEDLFRKEDFVRTEYYNDFLRPQDIHSCAIVRLARHNNLETTLNLSRPFGRGQFTKEDISVAGLLQPHVVRALKINQSLGLRTQVTAHLADVLDQSPHGLFLLDATGAIQHANREAERLLAAADGLCSVGGQLSAALRGAASTLEQLIRRAASPDLTLRSGGSMSITTPLRDAPISVTVAPLRPERFGATPAGWVLVCATDLAREVKAPDELLRQLFGLTAAEARVALALFEGASPRDAAAMLGVSFNTVRNQMTRIFEKTLTHKQSDLMRLIMRTMGVGGR
jgi:DNA-binding CsgD family transcriptional regulator/PAS domain-containing protein